MRIVNEAFYDPTTKKDFINDPDKIIDALHATWLGLLSVRQIVGNSFRVKKLFKGEKDLTITKIDDDNNDMSLIIKLASDNNLINGITAKKMLLFLKSMKIEASPVLDELEIRSWFESPSRIKPPADNRLKKIRKEFVQGKTLSDCIFDIWSYLRLNKKEYSETNVFQFIKHTMYFPPKGSVVDRKGGGVSVSAPSSSIPVNQIPAGAMIKRPRGRPRKIDPNAPNAQSQVIQAVQNPIVVAPPPLAVPVIDKSIITIERINEFLNDDIDNQYKYTHDRIKKDDLMNDRSFIAACFLIRARHDDAISHLEDDIKIITGETDPEKIFDFYHDEFEDLMKLNTALLVTPFSANEAPTPRIANILILFASLGSEFKAVIDFFNDNAKIIKSILDASNLFNDFVAKPIFKKTNFFMEYLNKNVGASIKDFYTFVYNNYDDVSNTLSYNDSYENNLAKINVSSMTQLFPFIDQRIDLSKILNATSLDLAENGIKDERQASSNSGYYYRNRRRRHSNRLNSSVLKLLPIFVIQRLLTENKCTIKEVYETILEVNRQSGGSRLVYQLKDYYSQMYRETLDFSLMSDTEFISYCSDYENKMTSKEIWKKVVEFKKEYLLDDTLFLKVLNDKGIRSLYKLSNGETNFFGAEFLMPSDYLSLYGDQEKLLDLTLEKYATQFLSDGYEGRYPSIFGDLYILSGNYPKARKILDDVLNLSTSINLHLVIYSFILNNKTDSEIYDWIERAEVIKTGTWNNPPTYFYHSSGQDPLTNDDIKMLAKKSTLLLMGFVTKNPDKLAIAGKDITDLIDVDQVESGDTSLNKDVFDYFVKNDGQIRNFVIDGKISEPITSPIDHVIKIMISKFFTDSDKMNLAYQCLSLEKEENLFFALRKTIRALNLKQDFMNFLYSKDYDLYKKIVLSVDDWKTLEDLLLSKVNTVTFTDEILKHAVKVLTKQNIEDTSGKGRIITQFLNNWSQNSNYDAFRDLLLMNDDFRSAIKSARRVWPYINTVFEMIASNKTKYENNASAINFLEWFEKNNRNKFSMLMMKRLAVVADSLQAIKIIEDSHNILPVGDKVKANPKMVIDYLKVNDEELSLEQTFKDTLPQKDKKEAFFDYLDRLLSLGGDLTKAYNDKIPDPKVKPLSMSEQELFDLTLELNHSYGLKRHSDHGFKVLKVFESTPTNEQEFNAFHQELIAQGKTVTVAEPLFHGTGTLKANMILRYFFLANAKNKGVSGSGSCLGEGVYLAPGIDKVLNYMCDDTNYRNELGNEGFVLQCKALLYDESGKYDNNGGFTQALGNNTGWASNEYCIHTDPPTKAVLILKAYYGVSVSFSELEAEWEKRGVKDPCGLKCFGDTRT